MRTSARTVALLLFPEVDLLDVASVAHVLSAAGRQWNWRPFRVVPVAAAPGRIETRGQVAVEAVAALEDCRTPEILIVPGGYGARRAATDPTLIGWTGAAGASASHIVCVGAGAGLVAAAGLADGLPIAVAKEAAIRMAELGPRAILETDRALVTEGRLLSAARSGRAVDLSLSLVRAVLGEKQARTVAEGLGVKTGAALEAPSAPVGVEIVEPSE